MRSVQDLIESYGVLDAPEDDDLHAIARLAAHICGVPTATVNLIDDVHQHQVATEGFAGGRSTRAQSMCAVTAELADPVHLSDARTDPRFAASPYVTGELGNVRFYASSQLRSEHGTVGTLCVFDEVTHELDKGQRAALDDLAAQATQLLELRARSFQLSQSNAELSRSNADLASFAGRIAHDLRNPLGATAGFLRLAQTSFGSDLAGRARECVEYAAAATERMTELVDDLLAYARVGARIRCEAVDLAAVVAAVVRDVEVLLTTSGGSVLAGTLPTVDSDPTLLRQLLQNFVTNGLKYGRPGVPPIVSVAGHSAADGWEVTVTDNGRGIPADDRDAVFEPFVRLTNGLDVRGSGIGLATCARVADALGGTIAITDTKGGGTTFTLSVQATD